jgi:hypothetical protein
MFNRKLKKLACWIVCFSIVLISSSCKKTTEAVPSFEKSLFYALPEGGIALYDFSLNKEIKLTNKLDYYPTPLNDNETILFLRLKEVFTGSGKDRKSKMETYVCSYNVRLNREKQIIKLKNFSPGRDLKDDCYFVKNGEYLLVLSYSRPYELISVKTGESVNLNILDFMNDCNQYDSTGDNLYIRVRQNPQKSLFKNPQYIENTPSYEALIKLSKEFQMVKLFEIPKEKMFTSTIYGFSFSQNLNFLAYSIDKEIYLLEGNNSKRLTMGVHPAFLKKKIVDKPEFKFPFFNLSYIYRAKTSKEENILFCAKNYLSIFNSSKKDFRILTYDDVILSTSYKENDKAYLFSKLTYIGKLATKDLFISVTYKEGDPTAGPENILSISDSPDTVVLFSFENGKLIKKLDIGGRESLEIEFKDLNGDGSIEIIVQYAASNFKCEERFKIAGRALVWKDIYSLSEKGEYEQADGKFPEVYKELLKQLEPLYSNAMAAKRLKQPILCDDDLNTLSQLVENAKAIIYYNR